MTGLKTCHSPINTEPLVGLHRHFVRRETDTFSTVTKYKEVAVSYNFLQNSFCKKMLYSLKSRKKVHTFTFPNCIKVVKFLRVVQHQLAFSCLIARIVLTNKQVPEKTKFFN